MDVKLQIDFAILHFFCTENHGVVWRFRFWFTDEQIKKTKEF